MSALISTDISGVPIASGRGRSAVIIDFHAARAERQSEQPRLRAAAAAASLRVRDIAVRAVAYLLALAAAVSLAIVVGLALRPDPYAGPTRTHSVVAGETVWGLAQRVDSERPLEDVVKDIRTLNALDSDLLTVGAVVVLPQQ